jgi:trehalose 6-phosphate synthase
VDDVVVVSNRGPVSFRLDDDGRLVRAGSGGGLAATIRPLLLGSGTHWVAAAMSEADRRAAAEGLMVDDGIRIESVTCDPDDYRMAYDVVSNATLWFIHHHLFDLPRRPRLDRHWHRAWDAYAAVNRSFADVVGAAAPPGAVVLVQDYHLALTGRMLADTRPDLRTVHFSHTPFADPSMLRVLPGAAAGELLEGLAGFGACGFHTARWEAAFRACLDDPVLRRGGRTPATFHAPLGPDPEAVAEQARSPECAAARRLLDDQVGDCQAIVRVDRIELSKNIVRGLWALDQLFEDRPEWRQRVVLVNLAYPSREGLADYLAYRSEIEHTAERINERWGTADWSPVLLSLEDDRARSVAALGRYDVLLVNPVRDGLNLVAKEGPIANTVDGQLVLSREAGAYDELSPDALGINPFDVSETAAALHRALAMGADERAARAASLRRRVLSRTAADWLDDQRAAARALDLARG